MFGEFAPLVMDTGSGPEDMCAMDTVRSISPSCIKLHSEQPTSASLARPEPLKASNLVASLSIPSLTDTTAFPTLASMFTRVPASPAKTVTSSVSGSSEQPSLASTPLLSMDDAAGSVMRRGSKVTRVT